MINIIF